ncbi:MAG: sigma factor-like helix-turn-helix DNA-binding protein [Pseudomonas sp.]|uniref:sigma factor-like helix-turn-helix DNA-binding protein n=1 Tax=Pseudomonas sp. TaxID=306 RepID=UPI0027370DB9|nr:sigma factor-like helix-turn-helix DNA-binding protein [Pseudomonas sp.]MDP3846640.1 sigma factor-like helix-turn-helix DNA-binding protein [Pseudomonas sp.]
MHVLSEMTTAARSLKAQMIAAGLLPATETSGRLDILIAKLDVEDFLSLRALPAFWELLAFWQIPADIEQPSTSQKEQGVLTFADEQQHRTLNPPPLSYHADVKAGSSATDVPPRLPHPQTLIGDVQLGGRFDKLIARLCRSASRSAGVTVTFERLEDILNLPVEGLLRLDGVGKAYRDDWQELKVLYIQAAEFLPVPPDLSGVVDPLELVREDMRLNLTQLDAADLKVIAKLERVIGRADIRTILSFDSLEQDATGSLVGRTRSQLLQVRERLAAELQLITTGTLDYHTAPTSLITSTAQSFASVAELGGFLLDRVDTFLATLDEKSQLIFQHRWGFVDERLTLSEIGKKYAVSRERIRQLESKINERLNGYLALDSAEIWRAVTSLSQETLHLEMADLSECFAEQAHFHDFLAFVSHGRIVSTVSSTHPPLAILDGYFALYGAAVDQLVVLQYLQQELGGDEKDASNALQFLHAKAQVAFESGKVLPLNLGKHEAAAAVLSEHPNGLPWLDIARHANRRGISRSSFSEQTSGHGLQDSALMYVAGKGVYRHTRYVDFSTVDKPAIFQALHTYFATSAREVSHLSEAHAGLPELRKHDYYILRYVVKMHGEDYGIYFNGKSQTDSISLNPAFDLYSQKSVILHSMRQRLGPLTSNEVAQLLKSRSSRHAKFYLSELMFTNQVVQVDRMLYTTPEHAYENIDLDAMRHAIESVLRSHDKPVDPSIIQYELNALQGEAYSKYFYSSLARFFAQLGHWQRRHSLFALQPISFASLTDAIDTLCKPDDSLEQNLQSLRLHIAINEEAARVSLYNWKAAKARLAAGVGVPEVEDELEGELEID